MISEDGIVNEDNDSALNCQKSSNYEQVSLEMEKIILENNKFRENHKHKFLKEIIILKLNLLNYQMCILTFIPKQLPILLT